MGEVRADRRHINMNDDIDNMDFIPLMRGSPPDLSVGGCHVYGTAHLEILVDGLNKHQVYFLVIVIPVTATDVMFDCACAFVGTKSSMLCCPDSKVAFIV